MRLRRTFDAGIARESDGSLDLNEVYLVEGSCRDGLSMGRHARLLCREVVSAYLTA